MPTVLECSDGEKREFADHVVKANLVPKAEFVRKREIEKEAAKKAAAAELAEKKKAESKNAGGK